MHVRRIGLTPLKGVRHQVRDEVELGADGPAGDRLFCLVDPERGQVLRTVEAPALLATAARFSDGVLSVTLPTETVDGVPTSTGQVLTVDYWGRATPVEMLAGPWADAYARHLHREVVLARPTAPGGAVYGDPVSLVTTSSLDRLAAAVGAPVDGARFRATFVVDTDGAAPHVEDSWAGELLQVGEAEIRVRGPLPRCAVVDLDPTTGERELPVLGALAGYRRALGEILFGVDAVVTRPGRVAVDAVVERG